ncbi:hypothetical protein FB451DRAFT_1415494 [Mycena latifolia]|nr:hypothetical protein FB451DRAFT_1415494 [Mycena latifolia]
MVDDHGHIFTRLNIHHRPPSTVVARDVTLPWHQTCPASVSAPPASTSSAPAPPAPVHAASAAARTGAMSEHECYMYALNDSEDDAAEDDIPKVSGLAARLARLEGCAVHVRRQLEQKRAAHIRLTLQIISLEGELQANVLSREQITREMREEGWLDDVDDLRQERVRLELDSFERERAERQITGLESECAEREAQGGALEPEDVWRMRHLQAGVLRHPARKSQ